MVDGQRLVRGAPPRPAPAAEFFAAGGVAKSPVHSTRITRTGHGQGIDGVRTQGVADAIERDALAQGLAQRRGVHHGAIGLRMARQAERYRDATEADPCRHIEVVHIRRTQLAPEMRQLLECLQALRCPAGQERRIDGPGRRADQDLERERAGSLETAVQHRCKRAQHAHLVGRTRAATHQDQANRGAAVFTQTGVDDRVQAHLHIL